MIIKPSSQRLRRICPTLPRDAPRCPAKVLGSRGVAPARVADSTDLKSRFPGATGYSPRNLKYMRAFAAAWPDSAFVQRTVAQLPWRHHVALLEKLDDAEARLWYAAAAVERRTATNRRSASCSARTRNESSRSTH
ncbi:DUF1016 N-terminal domain-containing protein [Kribbella sp. NBC_00709]|uniref:DUF1016 N-terminal domain-containing protein n=1 Tax=Kribbella sp. NBC_00709 TaxID=2975972 RepID=UPI003FA57737